MAKHPHGSEDASSSFWRSKAGVILIMLIAIGAFYLIREHFGHISPYLPYLILLACPVMHFFGHGHGGNSPHDDPTETHKDEKRS